MARNTDNKSAVQDGLTNSVHTLTNQHSQDHIRSEETDPKGQIESTLVYIDADYGPTVKEALSSVSSNQDYLAVFSSKACMSQASSVIYATQGQTTEFVDKRWKHLKDIVRNEVFGDVDSYAYEIIRGWYKSHTLDDEPDLTFMGVQLGLLVQFELSTALPQLLRRVKLVRTLLDVLKPTELILVTNDEELLRVSNFITGQLGVKLKLIIPDIQGRKVPSLRRRAKALLEFAGASLFDLYAHLALSIRRKLSPSAQGKRVILIESIARLFPLTDELTKRNNYSPVLIGMGGYMRRWTEAAKNRRLFHPFSYWLNPKALKASLQARPKMDSLWKRLSKNTAWQENVFFCDNLDLWKLLSPLIQNAVQNLFPRRVGQIMAAHALLVHYRPKEVVLDCDLSDFQVTLCELCRRMSIPTLNVHHGAHYGILYGTPPYDVIKADKMAAWGSVHKEYYASKGVAEEQIVPAGSAVFDALNERLKVKDRHRAAKELVCKRLSLDPNKKILTFATTYTAADGIINALSNEEEDGLSLLRSILTAIDNRPEWQLVVKLHPHEESSKYANILRDFPACEDRVVIIEITPLHDLIDASEFLVMPDSTVGLEAIILGVPVIVQFGVTYDSPYTKYEAVLPVYELGDLSAAVNQMIDNPEIRQRLLANRGKYLQGCGYLIDGKSAERLVLCVEDLALQSGG